MCTQSEEEYVYMKFVLNASVWSKKCKQASQTEFNKANYSAACWYVYNIADAFP